MAWRKGLFDANPVWVPPTRAPRSADDDVDPALLSDDELFEYRRRTAPAEDTRFMLRVATLSDELRKEFELLLRDVDDGLNRSEWEARYVELQDRWRHEANQREGYTYTPNGHDSRDPHPHHKAAVDAKSESEPPTPEPPPESERPRTIVPFRPSPPATHKEQAHDDQDHRERQGQPSGQTG
jgi:hypothetical protein